MYIPIQVVTKQFVLVFPFSICISIILVEWVSLNVQIIWNSPLLIQSTPSYGQLILISMIERLLHMACARLV